MHFAAMTWPQLRAVDRERTVVLAPIAACEQHSRHLPTFTDTLLVTAIAEGTERRLPQQVLLLPTLWFGASSHHLPFGATLSARESLHVEMLCELLTPLLNDGYRRVLLLNGHGGNIDTLQLALRQLHPRFRDRILCGASYWDLAEREFAAIAEGPRKTMGHACEFETSMMLALWPNLVRKEEIRNDYREADPVLAGLFVAEDMGQRTQQGCFGFPELGTEAKGRQLLNVATERVVAVVEALLQRSAPRT
jgi:creatinine amidohydrolase